MKKVVCAVALLFALQGLSFAQDASKQAAKKTAKDYITDLSSKDESVVISAADWLGTEKESDALPGLKSLLKEDNRHKVRLSAAMAIGYIGEESSLDSLNEQLLREQVADVRYAIVLAITRVGISDKKHLDILKQARERESDPLVKDYYDKMWSAFTKKAD